MDVLGTEDGGAEEPGFEDDGFDVERSELFLY